jgi:hypothetical protein
MSVVCGDVMPELGVHPFRDGLATIVILDAGVG